MTAPDPGFQFWTHGRHEKEPLAMLAELRAEAEWRRRNGEEKIARGRQTEMALQHDLNIIAELIADFEIAAGQRSQDQRARPTFTWAQKLNELRAIIMRRRNSDADRIARGRLNVATSFHAIATFEAAHAWYWNKGLDFMEGDRGFAEGSRIANIRAEYRRRERWARDQGYAYDPQIHDAIFTGDWSAVPKVEQAA